MCRFVAYKGLPITVDELLFQPAHSLVTQSYEAREIAEPLNGDGFGLGWYASELTPEPALFVSVTPAWNNRNLCRMASRLQSPVIFAHVRAANSGYVAEANCHPFHHKDMLMMHNGRVAGFPHIKRALMARLSAARFDWIEGTTDSEHLFALFLDHYLGQDQRGSEAMADALQATFHDLTELLDEAGVDEPSFLNVVVTDGKQMAASRYVDKPGVKPLSLHHTEGSRYVCDDRGCFMRDAASHEQAVLIASEPLTDEAHHWHDVPAHHFVMVDELAKVAFRAIDG